MVFQDRKEAGLRLAERLSFLDARDAVVFALPRGGIPVAREVAKALHCPLDTVVVRKLGVPSDPEFAFGAIAEGGTIVLDRRTVAMLGLREGEIANIADRETRELERRSSLFHADGWRTRQGIATAVLVDDGMATGLTMEAAIRSMRTAHPQARIIVAVPFASESAMRRIRPIADTCVAVIEDGPIGSVGQCYRSFPQAEEGEAIALLQGM